MLFEHIVYSSAIAIIAGMLYSRRTGRDPSWIIVASAFIPDLDIIADAALKKLNIVVLIYGDPIKHGYFHNILVMFIFAFFVALLLHMIKIRPIDSFIFANIGFAAHLFEDSLVYSSSDLYNHLGYRFFWPISMQKFGFGIVEYNVDFYGIADIEVLGLGLNALILSIFIRTIYEGNGWIKKMLIPKIFVFDI